MTALSKSERALGRALRYRIEQRGGATLIVLEGLLSEEADLSPLAKLPGPLVIDLNKLDRINSLGVREWIYFVREREAAGIDITFERVSPVMVSQMSMIANFMGSRSRVKSVQVPYFCAKCGAEHLELVDVGGGSAISPSLPCPKCRAPMEIDDLVETYTKLFETG